MGFPLFLWLLSVPLYPNLPRQAETQEPRGLRKEAAGFFVIAEASAYLAGAAVASAGVSTSSISAVSAPSPWRKPVLRMRV
jgi:hypothetical protein